MIERKAREEENIISYNKALGTTSTKSTLKLNTLNFFLTYVHELERVEATSPSHNQMMM
jgi:hypothetical protein